MNIEVKILGKLDPGAVRVVKQIFGSLLNVGAKFNYSNHLNSEFIWKPNSLMFSIQITVQKDDTVNIRIPD